MRRIKLFEAFTNVNKIEKVNFILFDWAVKAFIAEHDLEFKMFSVPNEYDVFTIRKIIVNPSGQDLAIDYFKCEVNLHGKDFKSAIILIRCKLALGKFFVDKNIISTNDVIDYEIVKEVIKKIYQDEKNKTI